MTVPAAKVCFPAEDREWILSEIKHALETGALTLGPHTRLFEEEFASQQQVNTRSRLIVAPANGRQPGNEC